MLPHEYLDGLYVLRRQEQAEILESIGRVAQKESALTAGRVADHISQLREESRPLLEAIDSEIERMTGYCSSWFYKLWAASHAWRGFIWMITAMTVLCFLFWAPVNATGHLYGDCCCAFFHLGHLVQRDTRLSTQGLTALRPEGGYFCFLSSLSWRASAQVRSRPP